MKPSACKNCLTWARVFGAAFVSLFVWRGIRHLGFLVFHTNMRLKVCCSTIRMLVLWFYLRCWSLGVNISTERTRTGPKPKKVESTDSGHSAYGFIFGISHHWSLQFGYGLKTMTN
ncbi:hypothetical protein HanIR_Chr03g0101471 [Helianthus annuus]|nr:hypothetical protein HanIR_Chr03g0101471 [Helianthus annuus]